MESRFKMTSSLSYIRLLTCFGNLYDGAVLLLIMGRIGMSILCNFNCALSVGGDGFFCVKYFICCLSLPTSIRHGHQHRMTVTRGYIDTISFS